MFYKKLDSGKYRYYEKYYDERERKWKQVSVTLSSKSRVMQSTAKRLLSEKIEAKMDQYSLPDNDWLVSEAMIEFKKIRRLEVKESTYTQQGFILDQFLQKFERKRLADIKRSHLQSYLFDFAWSNSYRRLVKAVIGLFFTYCVKTGYMKVNPMEQVVLPKARKDLEGLKAKQERYLDQEQMNLFLAYLDEHGSNPIFNYLIEFMYLTGLRIGEALALQWDDVCLEGRYFEVKYTLRVRKGGEAYLSSPKTVNSYRKVSFSSRVEEILVALKFEQGSGFVFMHKERTIRIHSFNLYLQKHFGNSGIEKSDNFTLTSHVLRHSHISLLAELNIPLKVIMDRVGHSDEKTTLAIYTHVTESMQDNLREKLELVHVPKTNQKSDKG